MKHTIVHFEIPADDVERAKAFYGGLFGWEFSTMPEFPGYWTFLTGDPQADAGGGLMARQSPEQVGLVNYFGVESVVDALAKVEKLGGKLAMPKTPVPGMGWFAEVFDPEGNLLAFFESDASAA